MPLRTRLTYMAYDITEAFHRSYNYDAECLGHGLRRGQLLQTSNKWHQYTWSVLVKKYFGQPIFHIQHHNILILILLLILIKHCTVLSTQHSTNRHCCEWVITCWSCWAKPGHETSCSSAKPCMKMSKSGLFPLYYGSLCIIPRDFHTSSEEGNELYRAYAKI